MELAIVAPVLVLLIFGVIEYSWMFLKAGDLSSAAREGARYAVTPYVTSTSQLTAMDSPLVRVLGNAKIPMSAVTVTCIGLTYDTPTGQPITVSVSVPYSTVKLVGLVPGPTNLAASVTMLKEGL